MTLLRPLHRHWIAAGTLALATMPSLASAQASGASRTIWKGKSDAYDIEWSTSNLRVTRSASGAVVLDAAQDANARWKKLVPPDKGAPMEMTVTYRLLSVVGPYLSIEQTEFCDCGGAHPSGVKHFYAIDLNRTAPATWTSASLSDVFPPAAISSALGHDAVIRKVLGSAGQPPSLTALLNALKDKTARVKDCDYSFSLEPMQSFALYDTQRGSVLVRVGLPSATEVCRGDLVQLGLTLATPKAMLSSFTSAKQRRKGLLMVDAQRLGRSGSTTFQFERTK